MSFRIRISVYLALLYAGVATLPAAEPLRRLPPVDGVHAEIRAAQVVPAGPGDTPVRDAEAVLPPPTTRSWWRELIHQPQRPGARFVPVDPQGLLLAALLHSDHVRAIRETPAIVEEEINKANAAFDVTAFVESKFDDLSDPVGSTLTTGGPPRLNDHHLRSSTGVRKRTELGGTIEVSQDVGLQDTNSLFFLPANQSQTRLTLGVTQPLLKQNGRAYARSVIVIAELDAAIAQQEFSTLLQDHSYQVLQAYWDLYFQRSLTIQRQRSLGATREILEQLEQRRGVDVLANQIARARSAVATRQASLVRARADLRNAEARVRVLTNAPELNDGGDVELGPVEMPADMLLPVDPAAAMATATRQRPEIAAAFERLRTAQVRVGVSRNELLPTLNLVVQSYISGLQGQFDVLRSVEQQFNSGAPSYTAGLMFQVPLGNQAAKAEHRKRQRELSQLIYELNTVLKTISLEVEVAVRDVEATYQETLGRFEALAASQEELAYLQARWRMLPGDERLVSFLLDETLDAHDRLLESEAACVRAQTDYALALARLQRATGGLVQVADGGWGTPQVATMPHADSNHPVRRR